MTNNTCVGAVQLNVLRVSRLLSGGWIDAGSSNLYTTDSAIEVGVTPVYADATELEQRNGSDVVCVAYKGPDSFKRLDLTMSLCTWDAELLEMLCGQDRILSGGNTIGSQLQTDPNSDFVCLEGWQTVIEGGEPTGEYIHLVWPRTRWRPGASTRNNGISTVPLVGTGFANANIGLGPAGDWPQAMRAPENWWVTNTTPPDAVCGYQTASVGS